MSDPLRAVRERFHIPEGILYFDGNSLGLLSRDAEAAVLRVLEEWKRLGVRGWLEANPPWFTLCEDLAGRVGRLIGAAPGSVAVTGSTTGNLHQIVASLYRPRGKRRRILAEEGNFPTDLYALRAQIALAGGDPERDLRLLAPRDGSLLEEDDLIAAMNTTVALAFFSAVQFRSAQLLDVPRVSVAARERGVTIGWDLSHSIGVLPHDLDRWGVDFAVWCHYKYLNAGPGALAGLYVNPRHAGIAPALPGWWGSRKDRQFDLPLSFEPAPDAGAFQVGTPPILGIAALAGSLDLLESVGIEAVRARSLELTDRLIERIEALLPEAETGIAVLTPRAPARRGGHVALGVPRIAASVNAAAKAGGLIPDFRAPDLIRLCPAPLYTSLEEVDAAITLLREIWETRAYERFPADREIVA